MHLPLPTLFVPRFDNYVTQNEGRHTPKESRPRAALPKTVGGILGVGLDNSDGEKPVTCTDGELLNHLEHRV